VKKLKTGWVVFWIVMGCFVAAAGCIAVFVLTFGDPPGIGPAHPVVVGARVDQGKLTVALACQPTPGSTVGLFFIPRVPLKPNNSPSLDFINDGSVSVFEPFSLPSGVELASAPLDWFIWQQAEKMYVSVDANGSRWGFEGMVVFGGLTTESLAHPAGEYYFGQAGWLTPDDVAARDGVDLLTVCDPVPPR